MNVHLTPPLSPLVTRIGTVRDAGRTWGAANAMHLDYRFDRVADMRQPRGFVAWPPPGYVFADAVWGRWSFSRDQLGRVQRVHDGVTCTRLFVSGPDFSDTSMSVADDGAMPAKIIHRGCALVVGPRRRHRIRAIRPTRRRRPLVHCHRARSPHRRHSPAAFRVRSVHVRPQRRLGRIQRGVEISQRHVRPSGPPHSPNPERTLTVHQSRGAP